MVWCGVDLGVYSQHTPRSIPRALRSIPRALERMRSNVEDLKSEGLCLEWVRVPIIMRSKDALQC